jgi:uncharacterized membrane protein YgdD (TMEM256/DUF423 family)
MTSKTQRAPRWPLVAGAVSGATAVTAGAFGAHALKARLTQQLLAIFETAARYHMYHALALTLTAVLAVLPLDTVGLSGAERRRGLFVTAAALFLGGTVVFSGTLYALALSGARWLGAITPLGGLLLIAGWVTLAFAAIVARR